MKRLLLALAAAAGLPLGSAQAGIFTISDQSLANDCFNYAEARESGRHALEVCSRALEMEPLDIQDQAATYVNRGIIHMLRHDFRGAEADFDLAIAMDPAQADGWLNKGFLRLRTGDGNAALPLLERALRLRPRRLALAYFARGMAHEQTGNLRAAYADLDRARELEPGWSVPARELARYQVVR